MNYIKHIHTAKNRVYTTMYPGIIFLCMFMLSGCLFSYKEPSKNPSVSYISISNKEVITTRDLTITWEGNSYAYFYQYTIDNIESEITENNSVTLTDLDDGAHLFILRAYDETLELKSSSKLINFTVNAVTGPGNIVIPAEYHRPDINIRFACRHRGLDGSSY